jgi:hypothetical protein
MDLLRYEDSIFLTAYNNYATMPQNREGDIYGIKENVEKHLSGNEA